MEDKTPVQKDQKDPREVILDLNFVPQWARKPPGENHYSKKSFADERHPPRRDDRRGGSRDSNRRDNARRDDRRPPRRDDRSSQPQSDRPAQRPRPQPIKVLPVDVTFLPEQQRLASLVRQIHHTRRAYPLMDLANLMVHDPEGYLVKVEAKKDAGGFELYQCRSCKAVATTEEAIIQHLQSNHLTDMYEKEEIETDPPSGSFSCVARCRKTGTLIGPPNHHSYNEKLNELHQTRFASLSLEDFKRSIETVHEEEVIEQWKEESRKQTVYKLKSDPEAEGVDLRKAELNFSKKVPTMYEKTQRAIFPAKVAQALTDRDLTQAIRSAWAKESRFPLTMSFSMRAAFRHMHLHIFKAGKINFVTHVKSHPIKPEDTVDNIAEVLVFLKEHPGSTRLHLLEKLHPSLDPKSQEAKDALQPLGWLIDRGHIIEFFNGTLSVPLGRPRR